MPILGKYQRFVYSLMRLMVGFLFACNGAQKLFGVLGAQAPARGAWFVAAGIIEFTAGSLIGLGLFSSVAAFIASGEMAVAYFRAHAPRGFWPIENHGELAVLYCFIFLYIASHGDGLISLASLFHRGRRDRKSSDG